MRLMVSSTLQPARIYVSSTAISVKTLRCQTTEHRLPTHSSAALARCLSVAGSPRVALQQRPKAESDCSE